MAIKNKYKVERKYISNKKARSGNKNNVKFLVAHETANNSTGAEGHYKYFQNITIEASAHTFIDDKKILEIIPLDEKAWHVMYNQDKRLLGLGYANDNAIGTELCRPGNFKKAYDRYVWYHAYLCKKFGLQPKKHIVSHRELDPQRRSDPQSWLEPNGITWVRFINDVQNYFVNWEENANAVASKDKLAIDGRWGPATTRALQRYFDTIVDGVISGQPRNRSTLNIPSAQFGSGGSNLIEAMQKHYKSGIVDRKISGTSNLIKAMQRKYGLKIVDGYISHTSNLVKEIQRRLNNGTL